jgi:hypothetical protein
MPVKARSGNRTIHSQSLLQIIRNSKKDRECLYSMTFRNDGYATGSGGFDRVTAKKLTRPAGDSRAGRVRHGVDEAPVPDAGST